MSTPSPQLPLNEDQLRALDRKQLQALAKKENIKPANASSEKLIKRLLAKFYPAAENEVKIEPPCVSPERKYVRLATNPESIPHERSRASPASFATSARTPNSGISPIPVPHTSVNASTKTSSSGFAASKTVLRHPTLAQPSGPAFIEGSSRVQGPQRQHAVREGQALHLSYPTQPFPCPTRKLLHTHRLKLLQINDALLNVPSSISTMERMLPRLERTADTVTQAVDTAAWEGHYLEEKIVTMIYPQGWSNMSPGPAKGKWFALFGDGNKKRHQLEQEMEQEMDEAAVKDSGRESDGSTVGSLSGNRLKRSREAENGEEEAEPSKRRKSRESSQL